MNQEK